jgi:hypothetical protein
MKEKTTLGICCLTAVIISAPVAGAGGSDTNFFPSFADEHTVGLWLFDETDYPYTTVTDASQYEYDLRLMKGGRLVPGRFGNCLKCTPGLDYAVGYAAWKGEVSFTHMREVSGRPGSGVWGPTVAPEKLLDALAGKDFTCEFWLMLMSNPIQDVALIDLGDKYKPGFSVTLKPRAAGFVIENAYAGLKADCPTVLDQLWGRAWHHVAFTYSTASRKLNYYIDGKAQPPVTIVSTPEVTPPESVWPESLHHTTYGVFSKTERRDLPDFETRRQNRFNFALGHDRHGKHTLNGNIDELRFSDVVRYKADFPLPDSLSRNYRKGAPAAATANGPPLLFGTDKVYLPGEPVALGSRKHVFINEVMVERKQDIRLTVNPATDAVATNINAGGDTPFFDHEGKVWMVDTPGYGSAVGKIRLLLSEDGINFEKPDLGAVEYEGSKHNNLLFIHLPCWGRFFKDTNPNAHPEERFKFTGWIAQRGIYLYLSPDGIHWRRNDTCMLPLVSGGGCETFWDDQRGVYINLLKRDGSYNTGDFPAYGRGAALFETREVTKAWPFKQVPNPYFEGWPYPAVTGEGITVLGPDLFDADEGQVFRTRARKYAWAPDTYVAFLARNAQTELATSRDGINWHIFDEQADPPYLPSRLLLNGKGVGLKWVQDGLIRRGDEIWQYTDASGENNLRLSQRLDGFVSLDAGEQTGTVITKPFVFDGNKLVLNVAAKGPVKVAILNVAGMEITGFNIGLTDAPKKEVRCYSLAHCDPITSDSVRQVVTWQGSSDVGNLAGQTVRLRFEMQNAKLYAFQFEK